MATVFYPAIMEKSVDGFGVFFPDLPGCVSAGRTEQEAAENAEEALAGHLIVAAEFGDALAPPSPFDSIGRDPEIEEVARILVRAERPGKSIRVNVTLDEGLVAAIDKVAKNRSGFLADAARAALRENRL
ncbi:MAG: type II toxin-antitoxin system HicB family antitoxin [Sphingorhabdus sp.]